VRRNKTDRSDAEALLEAARSADLAAVPVKSEQQQALLSLHRLRTAWLASRTARLNTVRGILPQWRLCSVRSPRRCPQ
jgi:transposase